jgi:transcriptional antiterminator RfaH
MNHWAVVQTEAQRENAVRLLLSHIGIHCYFPRIKIRKRITGLFPGYLFVQLGARWYPVLWTPHVIRLLMAGDRPARLDDAIIADLQRRERNGLVKLPQPPHLHRGQRVRVISGPMEGQLGIYEGMTGKDRERVLLELLGRKVRIELSAKHLEPITAGDVSRKAS